MARSKNRRGSGAAPDTVVVAFLRDVGNTQRGTVREMLREQAAKLSRVPDPRRPRVYVVEKSRAQQLANFYGSPVEWLKLAAEEPAESQPPPLVDDQEDDEQVAEPAPRATRRQAPRPPAVEGGQSDAVTPQSRRRRGAGASRRKAPAVTDEELFDDGPTAPEETGRVSAADSPADDGEPDPAA